MRSVTLSIDGHSYLIHGDADLTGLRTDILAAVTAGGGIVEFPLTRSTLSVLITPTTSLSIESKQVPDRGHEPEPAPDSDTLHAFNYDELDW